MRTARTITTLYRLFWIVAKECTCGHRGKYLTSQRLFGCHQGHCHPHRGSYECTGREVYKTSRAFYNSNLGKYEQFVTSYFGYDKVPMNTGAEAVETAIKIARKWAYDVKVFGWNGQNHRVKATSTAARPPS